MSFWLFHGERDGFLYTSSWIAECRFVVCIWGMRRVDVGQTPAGSPVQALPVVKSSLSLIWSPEVLALRVLESLLLMPHHKGNQTIANQPTND
jgi:hypothetical protein